MIQRYQCASCGKRFDVEKNDVCPRCGAAVSPSVLTRMERKQTAERLRADGKLNYDDHCHEDDAWGDSYGKDAHRTAVKSHEAKLRADYAAHKSVDNPTRLSNANPARLSNAAPASKSGETGAGRPNEAPVAHAPARNPSVRKRSGGSHFLVWVFIAWAVFILFRAIIGFFGNVNEFGDFMDDFAFFFS